ncbi:hypothetical protein GA0061080_100163 [Gilliamella intestini]|uniref:Uncharacterized protein n=1 Tax=Gilliamella intestini TaxID=1798183 RepID=A0A1C3YRZ3_9GAMM|nr:hypothetical protein GA0061080_100163 [Gilliamella intestini]
MFSKYLAIRKIKNKNLNTCKAISEKTPYAFLEDYFNHEVQTTRCLPTFKLLILYN